MALEGASARRHGKAGESYWGRIISAVERHPFWLFRSKGSRSHAAMEYVSYKKTRQLLGLRNDQLIFVPIPRELPSTSLSVPDFQRVRPKKTLRVSWLTLLSSASFC
jgi:hypothetical protein